MRQQLNFSLHIYIYFFGGEEILCSQNVENLYRSTRLAFMKTAWPLLFKDTRAGFLQSFATSRCPSQAEATEGDTWDSSALHGTLQRYPRKEYCTLVKETLASMDEKAAQSKRDQDRLADIHSKVHVVVVVVVVVVVTLFHRHNLGSDDTTTSKPLWKWKNMFLLVAYTSRR